MCWDEGREKKGKKTKKKQKKKTKKGAFPDFFLKK
jgi:hypothetical protein